MTEQTFDTITAQVKLVIWDLDETFWQGTLSEEGITPVPAHVEMIRTLVDRGIMCAICSKNEFDQARAAVESLGVWDLFVFPHIAWSPKGQAIKAMIATMGLRDENVLFLDDNHLNLEEAQFFNPDLMVLDPTGVDLTGLLDLPQLAGKDDRSHSRLKQYQVMSQKQAEQAETGLSNTEFLRQSEIKVRVITDIDAHMDRVLELLNRTNQLNYTKVRANTPEEKEALAALLATPGVHAGLIEVRDRYGDYGVVGFFCVRTRYSGTTVHHLAFSCRTLNMGIEQWVWDYLGRPEVTVANPVANPVQSFEAVDWITEVTDFDTGDAADDRRLCLVGGCDLQQVSFYCGRQRDEFVNKQDDQERLVRYDDIGFFINPRDPALLHSRPLRDYMGYTLADMKALDESLAQSDLILLSLYFSVAGDNLFTFGGTEFGGKYWGAVPPARLRLLLRDPTQALTFAKDMFHRRLPLEERLRLTRACFEHADRLRRPETPLFLIGATVNHGPQAERSRDRRLAFNLMARTFCAETPNAVFIAPDEILDPSEFVDSDHYTRTGYFKIAELVNRHTAAAAETPPAERRQVS